MYRATSAMRGDMQAVDTYNQVQAAAAYNLVHTPESIINTVGFCATSVDDWGFGGDMLAYKYKYNGGFIPTTPYTPKLWGTNTYSLNDHIEFWTGAITIATTSYAIGSSISSISRVGTATISTSSNFTKYGIQNSFDDISYSLNSISRAPKGGLVRVLKDGTTVSYKGGQFIPKALAKPTLNFGTQTKSTSYASSLFGFSEVVPNYSGMGKGTAFSIGAFLSGLGVYQNNVSSGDNSTSETKQNDENTDKGVEFNQSK
jgi:hypothetical protein